MKSKRKGAVKRYAFPSGAWFPLPIMPTFVLTVALMLGGCAWMQGGGNRTLKQTQLDVSWPMTRYRNVAGFGGLTLAEKRRINAAYEAYQSAFDKALKEAGGNYDAPAPDYLKAAANDVFRVMAGTNLAP